MHSSDISNLNTPILRPKIAVRVSYNPFMNWWQASLKCKATGRPYRADLANLVCAETYERCLVETESLLTVLGVDWDVEDVGAEMLRAIRISATRAPTEESPSACEPNADHQNDTVTEYSQKRSPEAP